MTAKEDENRYRQRVLAMVGSLAVRGESPSGKAGAFEAPIPWFESMLPSHIN
jgi:hypothetical protein